MRVRVRNGTDHKIRVHITICVVALIVASLLYREARQQGFDHGFGAWMQTPRASGAWWICRSRAPGTGPRIRLTKRTPE